MKFDNVSAVREVTEYMRDADITNHSYNRARIDDLFNGSPPFSDAEANENHVDCNVNFLEATTICAKARSTWNNAFLKPGTYFTVGLDSGPSHKRAQWSTSITANLNRPLKRSRRFQEAIRGTGAQVVLHGIGPVWWPRSKTWCPEEIGIEDLLVPSGTRVNLDNLSHFAIYQQFTADELFRMTHGPKVDPGWNVKLVEKEISRLAKELVGQGDSYQDVLQPEKIVEWYKSNDGWLDTDRVPTANAYSFFYKDPNDKQDRWFKKMILENSTYEDADFLYNPTRPFAGDLSQLLHIQFGDGASTAPFRYHSVRSLGFLLYATCHLQNRLRCRFMDAIFEATLQYFRNVGAEDRSKVEKIDLQHLGIIPEGVTMVPPNERWQIREDLVVAGLAQNRQLMAENAASFVQDVDQGTAKELTATEVMARLNSANALVASLLSMSYTYAEYQYREIARRFCLKNSPDPDVQKFRKQCLMDGVPEEMLDSERWNIQPERVMGGGNKTLELAQARSLMEIKPQLDPPAQREVLRNYVLAVSDDSDLAQRLVPEDPNAVTPAAHDAELAIGALMTGGTVAVRKSMDHISYIEGFLGSLLSVMQDLKVLEQVGELPTHQQIMGLTNCIKHIEQHIAIIAQDKNEQQRVKQYQDILGKISNLIKGYSQRVDQAAEAKAKEAENDKSQADMLQATTKARIAEMNSRQKQRHNEIKLQNEQRRKNIQTMSEVQRNNLRTTAEIQALDAKTAADVRAKKHKAFANPRQNGSSN